MITNSLFPCARVKPILTSLQAGCKIKVISREFVATPQTIVFTFNIATPQTIVFTVCGVARPGYKVDSATGSYQGWI